MVDTPEASREDRVITAEMDQTAIDQQLRKLEARRAVLLVLGGTHVGRLVPLEKGERVFGRDPECDVCLPDDGVSRRHARVRSLPDGAWEVVDLGSTNGTSVNGSRIERQTLADGDRILIGHTVLKFVAEADVMAEYQERMYELTVRDPLTQVYNRRFFEDRLTAELAYARRHGSLVSLLMLDIDHFKRVNDTHGHLAGDRVLAEVAAVMRGQIRSEDVLARYGGEEFVLLVRETPAPGVMVLAERIRQQVRRQVVEHEDHSISVTVSLGAATLRGSAKLTNEILIAQADRLLYQAKAGGRNRTCAELLEEPLPEGTPGGAPAGDEGEGT